MNDITVCISTMNSNDSIIKTLDSLKKYPVIIIDASNKKEYILLQNICKNYMNVNVYRQKSKSLGLSRNEGLRRVKTKYVCMWGSDNVLLDDLEKSLEIMIKNNWVGIGIRTKLFYCHNYLEKASNFRWKIRITPGGKGVIGTPNLWDANILKKYRYYDIGYSDDADLCDRLKKDKYNFGYGKYYCYEMGKDTIKNIINRYIQYGKGDRLYYNKWGGKKLHAFSEISVCLMSKEPVINKIIYLPYFIFITIVRFIGWFK